MNNLRTTTHKGYQWADERFRVSTDIDVLIKNVIIILYMMIAIRRANSNEDMIVLYG